MKNEKLDWFPLYVYEFITDIAGWKNCEVGAYFRLLCYQWINESLPLDAERLALLANEPNETFIKMWAIIGSKFSVENEKNFNLKLEKVRKQQQKFIEKKSDAGSEGAKARWGSFKKPTIVEITSYCYERKNNISASAFFDFYESKNWMIGKNKMKNWQAAIRTWETKNKEKQPSQVYIKPKSTTLPSDSEYAKKYYQKTVSQEPSGLGSELKKRVDKIVNK